MFSSVTSNNDFEGTIQIPLLKRSEMKRKFNMIITEELKKYFILRRSCMGIIQPPCSGQAPILPVTSNQLKKW